MEKYYDKVSFFSQVFNFVLKILPYKRSSLTEDAAYRFVEKIKDKKFNNKGSYHLKYEYNVSSSMNVYSYNGSLNEIRNGILLYVHGGSYVENANYFQIKFAEDIADKSNLTMLFCDYPLAPNSYCVEMFELFFELYKKLLKKSVPIYFLGDSAGGGFVVAFAKYIKDKKLKLPEQIIAFSPWLDISMSDDSIYEDAKFDNMCGVDGTKYEGKLWARDIDVADPLISPCYADMTGINNITIITGDYDILKTQCIKFHEKLKKKNIKHNFIMYKKQGHIFGIFPHKEGRLIRRDIANILNGGNINE